MKDSVRAYFYAYNTPLEGAVPWMYQDILGLVTVAVGNLIDPIRHATGLDMIKPDGTPATQAEIDAEWWTVKRLQGAAKNGHRWVRQFTKLRMTEPGMRALVDSKLLQMEAHLKTRFADWDTWPADAQLGVLSLSWACGPAFQFPALAKSLRARDFDSAAGQSAINSKGNPGVIPRNRRQLILFRNAAEVERRCMDADTLYFPDAPGGVEA